jgi:hypothetical protein
MMPAVVGPQGPGLSLWLQTRLMLVDRGRCGWSMDEGDPFESHTERSEESRVSSFRT